MKKRKDGTEEETRFEWTSREQHMLFFFIYTMTYSANISYLMPDSDKKDNPRYLQYAILECFFAGPLIFLQTAIGQYTRNSCLCFGEMFPLAYGLGYSMLLISFLQLVIQIFYTSKLVFYSLCTLCNPAPPWMICFKILIKFYPNCLSKRDIELCPTRANSPDPCFKPGSRILSAYIFKQLLSFGRESIGSTTHWYATETVYVVVSCLFNALIVYIFLLFGLSKGLKSFYYPMRIGIILCLVLTLSTGVVLFIQPGVMVGFKELMMHFKEPKLFLFETWSSSWRIMVVAMRLAEGGHILFGAYIPKSNPDYWRSLILTAFYILITNCALIYYQLFLGLLLFKLNLRINEVLPETAENVVFVLFPTFLGILPSSYFFCLVYFFVLFLLNCFAMVVKIMVIETSITLPHNWGNYSVYFRYTIATVAIMMATCIERNDIAREVFRIHTLLEITAVLIVFCQIIMVMVYGIQNTVDDIEFLMGVKVQRVIRLSWVLSLVVCLATILDEMKHVDFSEDGTQKIIYIGILCTPVLVSVFGKFFQFAKKKNLVGLLRPTDLYGPVDVEDRINRVLYNPRLTVKYKRRKEVCFHSCLMDSTAVEKAIQQEIHQLRAFANQLVHKSLDHEAMDDEFAEMFHRHEMLLMKTCKANDRSMEKKMKYRVPSRNVDVGHQPELDTVRMNS